MGCPGGFWHLKNFLHLLCVVQMWGWKQGDQLQKPRRDSTATVEKCSDFGCVLKAELWASRYEA